MSPYIQREDRKPIDPFIEAAARTIDTPGELNYAITRLCHFYLTRDDELAHVPQAAYKDYNEVVGVLECAKLELYRAIIGKYEDKKRFEHGPVWP